METSCGSFTSLSAGIGDSLARHGMIFAKPQKHVLMISYFFPPVGGIGIAATQRVLKFLVGMNDSCWKPIVLTVRDDYYEHYFEKDDSYSDLIPRQIPVVRTKAFRGAERLLLWRARILNRSETKSLTSTSSSPRPRASLFQQFKDVLTSVLQIPDAQIVWLPYALWRGLSIIRRQPMDCIYATGSPWTSLLVGSFLKLISGTPLVLDFRDPWVTNPYRTHFHPLRKYLETLMERSVVRRADIVVSNTPELRDEFLRRYPDLPVARFQAIYNSIELEDGNGFSHASESHSDGRPPAIRLVHTGFLYGVRDPRKFLAALSKLLEEEPEWRQQLALELVGTIQLPYSLDGLLKSLKLDDITRVYGQVSHDRCLEYLQRASVLLLFQPGTYTQIPSKLFEYLTFQKPILALATPGGATYNFVDRESLGAVADCENEDNILTQLRLVLRQSTATDAKGKSATYDALLQRYSIEATTRLLLNTFTRAVARIQ
jgi:glycosyltransferase involved in cell wall biosynthesis